MRVFISHSQQDKGLAKKIRIHLIRRGVTVFDADQDIAIGSESTSIISEAITRSDALLVIISKNTNKSEWVQHEVAIAVSNKSKGNRIKLVPIVIEKNTEMPFFLKEYQYFDLLKYKNIDLALDKLIEDIKMNSERSFDTDLEARVSHLNIGRDILELDTLQHEEYSRYMSRQIFLVAAIATLIASVGFSLTLLGWVTKINLGEFSWLVAFIFGAASALVGSLFYTMREQAKKKEIQDRISKLEAAVRAMGVENE